MAYRPFNCSNAATVGAILQLHWSGFYILSKNQISVTDTFHEGCPAMVQSLFACNSHPLSIKVDYTKVYSKQLSLGGYCLDVFSTSTNLIGGLDVVSHLSSVSSVLITFTDYTSLVYCKSHPKVLL